MARDPNALKYPESWKDTPEDLKKLPPPPGVNKAEWDAKIAGGDYYANVKVYADGRQVVEWYQRNVGGGPGQPDPVQATSQAILPTVKEEWDKDEEKTPTTRTINGVPHQVTGKDANGQDIWAPVQTTTGTATTTTTAPAAPGGNAWKDDGIEQRERGRRWGWNPATRLYDRDLGPSPIAQEIQRNAGLSPDQDPRAETDAERAARGKETIARQERDAQQNRPTVDTTTINGQRYTTQTTPGRNGQPPKVEHFGPDGKPIAALPVEGKETTQPVTRNGQAYTEHVVTEGTTTTKYYTDKDGKKVDLPPEGLVKLPPGAPELDLSSPEAAYSTTLRYHQWLDARFRSGEMTASQVADAYAPAHTQAEMVINRAREQRVQQQQAITNALTQRSQDIGQTGTRLSSANTQFQEANRSAEAVGKLADPGMNATTNTRLGLMALQALNANLAGGMREAPPVVPGPVANLPQYPGTPATPPGAAAAAPPTLASPEGQGLLASNEATRQAVMAEQAAGAPGVGAAPALPRLIEGQARGDWMSPPAVQGMPSPLGDTGAPPVSMGDPTYGMPMMALAGSFSGQHPYQGAIDSLKAAGLDDATIDAALKGYVRGAA